MSKKSHAPFAPGFRLPSEANIQAAVGSFPWSDGPHSTMRTHQLKQMGEYSESLLNAVNSPHAYVNRLGKRNQKVWKDLPLPADDLSWLACYCEDGQTFEQFADSITLRSGRFKGCAMVEKPTIYLLPITHEGQWPSSAPSLEALVEWVSVYFSYTVKILDTAFLEKNTSSSKRASRHNVMVFRTADHSWPVQGRIEDDKLQTHVNGLLGCLTNIRISEKYGDTQIKDAFAVIGITMCDIYSSHSDLFVAGMACPSTHVGVLSFARYHPHIKMHPGEWTDVGYSKAPSAYPYIDTEKKRPNLSSSPPELSVAANAEFLRRAGKLLLHEIGHVLGMDHCIYHNCLMNGTGHLVEDFSSSPYLCGVCLRKLQFRRPFDPVLRYQQLKDFYHQHKLLKDMTWVQSRVRTLLQVCGDDVEDGEEVIVLSERRGSDAEENEPKPSKKQKRNHVIDLT